VALTLALHLKMTQCYLIQKVGKRSSLSCQWQLFSFIFLWQKFVFVRIVSLPLVSIIQLLLFHLSALLQLTPFSCRWEKPQTTQKQHLATALPCNSCSPLPFSKAPSFHPLTSFHVDPLNCQ